jgi:hypothetical protein
LPPTKACLLPQSSAHLAGLVTCYLFSSASCNLTHVNPATHLVTASGAHEHIAFASQQRTPADKVW